MGNIKENQPLVMWRADTKQWRAIQVQCPDGLHTKDSDGKSMYENTHFRTPEEAWERLREESSAWLKLSIRSMKQLESKINMAKEEVIMAGKAVVAVTECMKNME